MNLPIMYDWAKGLEASCLDFEIRVNSSLYSLLDFDQLDVLLSPAYLRINPCSFPKSTNSLNQYRNVIAAWCDVANYASFQRHFLEGTSLPAATTYNSIIFYPSNIQFSRMYSHSHEGVEQSDDKLLDILINKIPSPLVGSWVIHDSDYGTLFAEGSDRDKLLNFLKI